MSRTRDLFTPIPVSKHHIAIVQDLREKAIALGEAMEQLEECGLVPDPGYFDAALHRLEETFFFASKAVFHGKVKEVASGTPNSSEGSSPEAPGRVHAPSGADQEEKRGEPGAAVEAHPRAG